MKSSSAFISIGCDESSRNMGINDSCIPAIFLCSYADMTVSKVGCVCFRARYYSGELGRFISRGLYEEDYEMPEDPGLLNIIDDEGWHEIVEPTAR
ncbi:MAG: hypothetical protein HQL32_11445 [Planctomycetes bacterium]|nr:hypothetical protein [Planctomycetota bacterium]